MKRSEQMKHRFDKWKSENMHKVFMSISSLVGIAVASILYFIFHVSKNISIFVFVAIFFGLSIILCVREDNKR